jgi:Rrf2 family protein
MARLNSVSKKCTYALRAVFELALRETAEPVRIRTIAHAQGIPPRFLEVILAELKHGNFVESVRGNRGGYLLSRPAECLTLGEVISFLEGDLVKGRSPAAKRFGAWGDHAFAQVWNTVSNAISSIYDNLTFADLVQQERAFRGEYVPNYSI